MSAAFTLMHEDPYAFMPAMPKQVSKPRRRAGLQLPRFRVRSTMHTPIAILNTSCRTPVAPLMYERLVP